MFKINYKLQTVSEIYSNNFKKENLEKIPFTYYVDGYISFEKNNVVFFEENYFSLGAFLKDLYNWFTNKEKKSFEWDEEFDGWYGRIYISYYYSHFEIKILYDYNEITESLIVENISNNDFIKAINEFFEDSRKDILNYWNIDIFKT